MKAGLKKAERRQHAGKEHIHMPGLADRNDHPGITPPFAGSIPRPKGKGKNRGQIAGVGG